jgi:hypothetical protein
VQELILARALSEQAKAAIEEWTKECQAGRIAAPRRTPAVWMPGDPVLKSGPELVGNVWKEWKPNE